MECLLLLVDEVDDFIGTLRLYWVGLRRGAALLLMGIFGAATLLGITAIGLAPLLLCAAAIASSAVVAFGLRVRLNESLALIR